MARRAKGRDMTIITARILVASDGTVSGHVPSAVPAGEHEVRITLADGAVHL
jgi:hypothetical protein